MQIYREGYNTYGLSIPHLAIMSCWEIDIPLHQSTAFTITMASVYGGSELDTVLQQGSSCAPPLSSPLSSILTCGLQVDFSAAVCYTIRLRCQKGVAHAGGATRNTGRRGLLTSAAASYCFKWKLPASGK